MLPPKDSFIGIILRISRLVFIVLVNFLFFSYLSEIIPSDKMDVF